MNSKKSSQKPKSKTSAFSLESVNLEIEKLTFGGDGLSRHEGLIYFVPLSAPGDELKVRITETKKNFSRAEISEIKKPSTLRTEPLCPVFGQCGGCQWQHIQYSEQLKQKQIIVTDVLRSVVDTKTEILPIIPSPDEFRYRNRIQLKYDGKKLGFYGRKSHEIVDINDCPITEKILSDEIPKLKRSLQEKNSGPQDKIEIFIDQNQKIQSHFQFEENDALAFSQVNRKQNEILVKTVLDWTKNCQPTHVYDLYAGSGNFTFPLMNAFPKASLIGVELSEKAVQSAKQKILENNLSPHKMRFFLSDVEFFLKRHVLERNSVVLLDPPRTGCSERTIKYLGSSHIQQIFYVSCNPSTLARDLQRLRLEKKWRIRRIQAFDMFPQTSHVESLVELVVDSE